MMPDHSTFHFAEPWWLLGLLVPFLVWLWQRLTVARTKQGRIDRYADPELLPHLLNYSEPGAAARRRRLTRWSLIWLLLILAMAGPRWDFAETELFRPGSDLVILLDLSRSMEVADVMPSRLGRARQEIEDLLAINPTLRVGLIAFASVAHVVAPITEDREALRRVLPEIGTDLVRLQGSRLSSALDRAERLLLGQGEDNTHAILLISDGDFVEPGLEEQVRSLSSKGIQLHALGVGTTKGARVPGPNGAWIRDARGKLARSALNEPQLRALANAGGGIYRMADYRDDDVRAVIDRLLTQAPMEAVGDRNVRIWREHFFWLSGAALLLLIPWFRKTKERSVPSTPSGGSET